MTNLHGRHDRVVVGIDASQCSKYAVLWAAEEARVRRCALVITHIEPLPIDRDEVGRRSAAELHELLALSAAAASLLQPAVPVATLLLHGDVIDELLALSQTSLLLVVGSLVRLADRLIVQAACPVVVVSHRPCVDDARRRRVLAAHRDTALGRLLLKAAVDEAELRDDTLDVVLLPELRQAATPLANPANGYSMLADRGSDVDLLIVPAEQYEDGWSTGPDPWVADLVRQSPCPVMFLGRLSLSSPVAA